MRIFPKVYAALAAAAYFAPSPAARADEAPAHDGHYARAGVVELGGFVHFMAARDYSSLGIYPTFGWFPWDNFQLSAVLGASRLGQNIEDEDGDRADVSQTQLLVLAEPSLHVPFSAAVYGFLGMGVGLAHQARSPGPGAGTGFALAPRLGLNMVIASSSVLTPAVQGSYQTTEALATSDGGSWKAHSSLGFQVGYTVFW